MRLSEAGEEKFDMRTRSEETAGMSYREVAVKLWTSSGSDQGEGKGKGRVEEMGKDGQEGRETGSDGRG